MKKAIIFFTIVVTGFCLLSTAYSADVAKIGAVDSQRVLNESSAGKMFNNQIKDKGKEITDKLIAEQKAIEKMEKDLKREALVLSTEKKDEKAREIWIRKNDAKSMEKHLTQNFKKLQQEISIKFGKDLNKIVKDIGKKEGYLMIIELKQGGVIYFQDHIDITDKVIQEYNKLVAARNKNQDKK
jgi:outer membrane protein